MTAKPDPAAHRILLRGPWSCQFQAHQESQHTPQPTESPPSPWENLPETRLQLPCSWQTALGTVAGTARFNRSFHRPTGLTPHCQVLVKLDGYRGEGQLRLNGTFLATLPAEQTTGAWPVTALLLPRNTLSVILRFDPAAEDRPGGLFGLVAVEIVAGAPADTGAT